MHFFALAGPKYAWTRVAVKQFGTKRPLGMSGGLTEFGTGEDQKTGELYVLCLSFSF